MIEPRRVHSWCRALSLRGHVLVSPGDSLPSTRQRIPSKSNFTHLTCVNRYNICDPLTKLGHNIRHAPFEWDVESASRALL